MKPNAQRAKIAEYLIWITMGVEIIALINLFFAYRAIVNASNGIYVTVEEGAAMDTRALIIYAMTSLIFLASAVTYLMWFYRAYANQRQVFFMANTKGWAIGAWIVPIISLFKPYQMMKEMYVNAEDHLVKNGLDTARPGRLKLVGWWWACWIIYSIAANFGRNTDQVSNLSFLATIYIVIMCISVFFVVLSIVSVKVIRNYNQMEVVLLETADTVSSPENQELLDSF